MAQIDALLCCPYCKSDLDTDYACATCGTQFTVEASIPDLRVKKPVVLGQQYHYNPEFGYFPWDKLMLEWTLDANNGLKRDTNWANTEAMMLMSVERPDARNKYRALDIGCGHHRQRFREGLEELGYISVGMDIKGTAPDVLGDAHSLPFKDETFDVIMSSAVLEHLKNPFAAMSELYRVAKPGAKMYICIAYNEPFHISYFHHSPLAAHELLVSHDLVPDVFFVSAKWNTFNANLLMGFAGRYMPALLQRIVAGSILQYALLPARLKSIVKRDKAILRSARLSFARSHSGITGFIAHKKG